MNALLALALLASTIAPATSVVYSRYQSGRPRLVVKATHDPDELLLLRYADAPHARPRIVAREELDAAPVEVRLERIIDAKDIVVTFLARHGQSSVVERVAGNRFVQIADSFTEAVDLDGDGVREIISTGYAGQNDCGVALGAWLLRWNGKRYAADGRTYVTVLHLNGSDDDELRLDATKHYAVRLFGRGRVTLDGERVAPGKAFQTEEGCHTIELHGAGANTRAFLEELP